MQVRVRAWLLPAPAHPLTETPSTLNPNPLTLNLDLRLSGLRLSCGSDLSASGRGLLYEDVGDPMQALLGLGFGVWDLGFGV